MFGVTITEGPTDWQIIQQKQGMGTIHLKGDWQVPPAAIEVGTKTAFPLIRIMDENDNSQIIPWTKMNSNARKNQISGTWECTLTVPAGGLYRIETSLDTKSTNPELGWIFRGDVRFHIGVGDIFIIAGQSNSSGYGRDSAFDPPCLGVHLFRNKRTWDLAAHPINESTDISENNVNTEMGVSGVSPYISFGKNFQKLSHYPVGLISAALGGSPISRWDKDDVGDLYHDMLSKINDCNHAFAGVLWYQGCSDTEPSLAAVYEEKFRHLVENIRSELGYDIPFFTFQLNRQINGINDEGWGIVREAQRRAIHTIPKVYALSTLNCPLCDGIHNNAHANIMLGEKMAKLCSHVLYGTPEFFPPEISSAVLEDKILTLTFNHVKLGFMVYSDLAKDSGIMVKDSSGILPFNNIIYDKDRPNKIIIPLGQKPESACTVSFCWDAYPTSISFVDEVTYLPPLSFYEYPVTLTLAEVQTNFERIR